MARYVLSLGGSLVAPEGGPDAEFLDKFRKTIQTRIQTGDSFYIVVGGGRVCRDYIVALQELGITDNDTHDYMGIFTTHFNAHYVSLAFGLDPLGKVVLKPENVPTETDLHITGAGLQPGQSSDAPTVQTAIKVGATAVINLSNVAQVYTADPSDDSNATSLSNLSWSEYLDIIPTDWSPGLSTPFDPVASKLARDNGITVTILGPDLDNFQAYLDGDKFIGTVISD